ncbi:galanin receptor type 2-like [Anneissia japonica]|uniref:galanin receptor type 2-like n=1 Tax=Anneissia japonica TaxID=1529436 RepID=UPI001425ADA3|nr:galanin receptor type 2-like [Anneissia japonica]
MAFEDVINNVTDVLVTKNTTVLKEPEIVTTFSTTELDIWTEDNAAGLENVIISSNDLNLNWDYEDVLKEDTWIIIFTWCIYTMVFVTGCSGNILVMVSIHQCRQLKGAPAVLLANLAVADFLLCLILVPLQSYVYYTTEFLLGPIVCRLGTFLNQLVIACSSFTLTLISVERLYVVKHPLKTRAMITPRRARIAIVGVWLIAALCAAPNTYRQEHIYTDYRRAQCRPSFAQPWIHLNAMFDFVVKFTIPVLIMAISTLKMLGIANSCINPFIYVFMSKSFRSAIRTTLCRCP